MAIGSQHLNQQKKRFSHYGYYTPIKYMITDDAPHQRRSYLENRNQQLQLPTCSSNFKNSSPQKARPAQLDPKKNQHRRWSVPDLETRISMCAHVRSHSLILQLTQPRLNLITPKPPPSPRNEQEPKPPPLPYNASPDRRFLPAIHIMLLHTYAATTCVG